MGASLVYLDEPNKNIEWDAGEDDRVTFACGEMQGWRLNMVSARTNNPSSCLVPWLVSSITSLNENGAGYRQGFGLFPYIAFLTL